tara:strand:+ start:153 stop:455 length:303 start_codon:yes stop_codon:yes gene_type:complete
MTLYISSTLSVSREKKLDCNEVASYLESLGIRTLVKSNISTQPKREYGCQMTQGIQSRDEIRKIWEPLKDRYGFTCAHVSVGNVFDGCVLDFLAPTKCSR